MPLVKCSRCTNMKEEDKYKMCKTCRLISLLAKRQQRSYGIKTVAVTLDYRDLKILKVLCDHYNESPPNLIRRGLNELASKIGMNQEFRIRLRSIENKVSNIRGPKCQ